MLLGKGYGGQQSAHVGLVQMRSKRVFRAEHPRQRKFTTPKFSDGAASNSRISSIYAVAESNRTIALLHIPNVHDAVVALNEAPREVRLAARQLWRHHKSAERTHRDRRSR